MNKPLSRSFASIAITAAMVFAAGCGGGDSNDSSDSSAPGALHVSLTDAPSCGYDAVHVTVSKVRVHQSIAATDADAGWSDIVLSPPRRIDLLGLSNGVLLELGQTALPSGIKLQANVDVPAGQTVDVVLDFDACCSVVRRGASGRYNLEPVIAVIPMISVGAM